MTYLNKNTELQRGYNTYIDTAEDDYGTMMDVGLLLMEEGDTLYPECGAGRAQGDPVRGCRRRDSSSSEALRFSGYHLSQAP